jgi:hypothetical protein
MDGKTPASSFRQIFRNRHIVLPVIHVTTQNQALRNATIAVESGADGVFLINHSIGADQFLAIHAEVYREYPGWFVGVNCPGVAAKDVFGWLSPEVKGVWVDNAMIDERQDEQTEADAVSRARSDAEWNGLYFSGVVFKYQRSVDDPASASRLARR